MPSRGRRSKTERRSTRVPPPPHAPQPAERCRCRVRPVLALRRRAPSGRDRTRRPGVDRRRRRARPDRRRSPAHASRSTSSWTAVVSSPTLRRREAAASPAAEEQGVGLVTAGAERDEGAHAARPSRQRVGDRAGESRARRSGQRRRRASAATSTSRSVVEHVDGESAPRSVASCGAPVSARDIGTPRTTSPRGSRMPSAQNPPSSASPMTASESVGHPGRAGVICGVSMPMSSVGSSSRSKRDASRSSRAPGSAAARPRTHRGGSRRGHRRSTGCGGRPGSRAPSPACRRGSPQRSRRRPPA